MNEEHYNILKKGVKEWNQWRRQNPHIKPDLYKANLNRVNLEGANLSGVKFSVVNLNGAKLNKANFRKAILRKADLRNASLNEAFLTGANLEGANLEEANLKGANLDLVNLKGANLDHSDLRLSSFGGANLSKSKFNGANLSGANLSEANLSMANLSRAILKGASIRRANLTRTNLTRAKLKGANLNDAYLSEADLTKADLTEADLGRASLLNSKLKNVILTNSMLYRTVFGLTDLSTCRGLKSIKVSGKCIIDFETLKTSKNIPPDFLFRIGLPQNYIDYLPSFYNQNPIQLSYSVFLSHSSEDRKFVDVLYKYLTSNGVHVWYDQRKIRPGDIIAKEVEKAIDIYDKLVIVCSENSLKESLWIKKELFEAAKKEENLRKKHGKQINSIIPIRIDDYVMEQSGDIFSKLREYHIGDFRKWKDPQSFKIHTFLLKEAINANRQTFIPPSHYDV